MLPAPDLAPMEERLLYLKRNISRSLPNTRLESKTDSLAYNRVSGHLVSFITGQPNFRFSTGVVHVVVEYTLYYVDMSRIKSCVLICGTYTLSTKSSPRPRVLPCKIQ